MSTLGVLWEPHLRRICETLLFDLMQFFTVDPFIIFPLLLSDAESKPPSDETTPSDENTNKPAGSSKQAPSKEVNHLASVQKILKFRPINAEAPAAQSISG